MGKFNQTKKTNNIVINHEGHENYKLPNVKEEIANIILNHLLKGDTFYTNENEIIQEVSNLVTKCKDKDYILKAVLFAREKGNLRTISHLFMANFINQIKGWKNTKKTLRRLFKRPDEISEIVSAIGMLNGNTEKIRPIPNVVKKAGKEALETKFDAYQLRKYRMRSSQVTLSDLVKLFHPSSKKWQKKFNSDIDNIFKLVIEDRLPKIETAQTINTKITDEKERQKKYIEMIKERKLGLMAVLKNLTKILKEMEKIDKNMTNINIDKGLVTEQSKEISKEKKEYTKKEIEDILIEYFNSMCGTEANKKILPFRFIDVYMKIKNMASNKLKKAIEELFIESAKNIELPEGSLIAIDVSASMDGETLKNAVALAAILLAKNEKTDANVWVWASIAKKLEVYGLSPFAFIDKYFKKDYGGGLSYKFKFETGHGTEVGALLEAISNVKNAKTIFILTDMQLYDTNEWYDYTKTINKALKENLKENTKLILWDVRGYNKGTPFKVNNKQIYSFNGFSSKLIEYLSFILEGKSLVKIIDDYQL